jgi:TPR repeat protein
MIRRFFALLFFCTLFSAPAFAGFDEGREAYDKGHWIQAIINLRPLAEDGDTRAMILLGNMYMDGHGVAQDTKEAFGLYHAAAVGNNTDGMVATAALYQMGSGVPVNVPLAVSWFERAARLGNMDAALMYAIYMYQGSKGKDYDIKPNNESSYRWFKIIAAHSKNKKQVKAAEFSAGKIKAKLTNDEQIAAEREIDNWKPETIEEVGPNPEVKFVSDYNAAHKNDKPEDQNKKPDEKKSDGAAPEEKKADDKKPEEKKAEDKKKPAGKKAETKKDEIDTSPDDDSEDLTH